jgi:hypothetical protein
VRLLSESCACTNARSLAAARPVLPNREQFDRMSHRCHRSHNNESSSLSVCHRPLSTSFSRVVTDFVCRTDPLLTRSDGKMTVGEVDSNVLDICNCWHTDSDAIRLRICAPFCFKC